MRPNAFAAPARITIFVGREEKTALSSSPSSSRDDRPSWNWIITDRWGARLRVRPSSSALSRKSRKVERAFHREILRSAWYGLPIRGILLWSRWGRSRGPSSDETGGEEGSPESKTRDITTLIARINHNRGGKWRGELLKQGYVLGVVLLHPPRPFSPRVPWSLPILPASSSASSSSSLLLFLFPSPFPPRPFPPRLCRLTTSHPFYKTRTILSPSSNETVTPGWNCHLIYHSVLYRALCRITHRLTSKQQFKREIKKYV